jgi:ATP/maltotriose-dependent transcriptional regulator MalT
LCGRTARHLPLAPWLAHGTSALPIDARAFALTPDEAEAFAHRYAPNAPSALVARSIAASGGSPAILRYALATANDFPERAAAPAASDHLGGALVERTLDILTPEQAAFLEQAAAFPDLDVELLSAAGLADAREHLAALRERIPFAFEERDGRLYLAAPVATGLLRRAATRNPNFAGAARRALGAGFERSGRITEAFATFAHERSVPDILRVVAAHGLALAEDGRGDVVADALATLDPAAQMSDPVAVGLRAMAQSRLGHFEIAEGWFQLAIDRAGSPDVRAEIVLQHGQHLLRTFRPEAVDVLEPLAADGSLRADVRTYALAALGPALVSRCEFHRARTAADAALERAAHSTSKRLAAKAHHQAAFVALCSGDAERAKQLAAASLEDAAQFGYYDIAAGALTVLYNVASDVDDEPSEALTHLGALAVCAARSGSLVSQVVALLGSYEIAVERGDLAAADRYEKRARALDVKQFEQAVVEALIPAQALRCAWNGDFAGAYDVSAHSADLQWSADRQALRWAEISLYAAASGEYSAEAYAAIAAANGFLARAGQANGRTHRARIFLALALAMLGESSQAEAMFAVVDALPAGLTKRLQSLRALAGAVARRLRGERNHAELLEAVARMNACDFGGVARMIVSLPLAVSSTERLAALSDDERSVLLEWALRPGYEDARVSAIRRKLGIGGADNERAFTAKELVS